MFFSSSGHRRAGGVLRHAGAVHALGGGIPRRLLSHGQKFVRGDRQVLPTDPQGQGQGRVPRHHRGEQGRLESEQKGRPTTIEELRHILHDKWEIVKWPARLYIAPFKKPHRKKIRNLSKYTVYMNMLFLRIIARPCI